MSMALKDLSERDQTTIRRCLEYVLRSGALKGEFHTRMGVEEREVEEVLARWPEVDDSADQSPECLAINNALNEVTHGIHISNEEWFRWFQGAREEVEATYSRWTRSRS